MDGINSKNCSSELYSVHSRYVIQFEEVFSKYDRGNKGGLDLSDIMRLVKGNRNVFDPYGWTAAFLEWGVSYYLAAKETSRGKLLLKDDLCAIFDGCYFYDTAKYGLHACTRRQSRAISMS
jgi:peroxygenase